MSSNRTFWLPANLPSLQLGISILAILALTHGFIYLSSNNWDTYCISPIGRSISKGIGRSLSPLIPHSIVANKLLALGDNDYPSWPIQWNNQQVLIENLENGTRSYRFSRPPKGYGRKFLERFGDSRTDMRFFNAIAVHWVWFSILLILKVYQQRRSCQHLIDQAFIRTSMRLIWFGFSISVFSVFAACISDFVGSIWIDIVQTSTFSAWIQMRAIETSSNIAIGFSYLMFLTTVARYYEQNRQHKHKTKVEQSSLCKTLPIDGVKCWNCSYDIQNARICPECGESALDPYRRFCFTQFGYWIQSSANRQMKYRALCIGIFICTLTAPCWIACFQIALNVKI